MIGIQILMKIVSADPYPYTVAGASVALSIYWPGPDEAKVSRTMRIVEETYTVVEGDSLWDIAVRSYGDGYQWVKIAKANNLANPDLIYPGNVFKIPRN